MDKEKVNLNSKERYEKPKYKIVKPIFSNSFTTSAVAASPKNYQWKTV